jgi:hypothetical protein
LDVDFVIDRSYVWGAMIRRHSYIALFTLLALAPLVVVADTTIDFFAAKSSGDRVTVEWKTGAEQGIAKYEVERSPFGIETFELVGSVKAKGSYSYYSFVDESGFGKGSVAAALYQYRLRLWNADGTSSVTKPTVVEHSVSSVRRTWGQIKEMFR